MDAYAIIGNPAAHSLSPVMHEAAFEERGIDAKFNALEPDETDGGAAVGAAETLNFSGLTVTSPFKKDVMSEVELAESADRLGAVNTIDFTDDGPVGHNTDGPGAVEALEHHDVDLSGSAIVVGAGGAGRALAFSLADEGMDVHVANRTESKAHDLAADVPGATGHGLDELEALLTDASVLVNCTTVGMEEPDATPVPKGALHRDLAVLDAVYTPMETRLLREADEVGATTVDGAWMLLFQGVVAFELWTGEDAPVDAMNDALRSALE